MRSRQEANVLFRDGHLRDWIARRMDLALRDAASLTEERLLGTPMDDLVEHFAKKHLVEMVVVDRDGTTVADHGDVSVQKYDFGRTYTGSVHGVAFSVPFSGEPELFRYQGSMSTSMWPRAEVAAGALRITVVSEHADAQTVRQKLMSELDLIRQYLGGVAPMVSEYNQKVGSEIRSRLEARKKRVLESKSLVANLGFPVQARGQQAVPVPLSRKRITPALPPLSTSSFQPEPAISEEDYESILRTMQQMTLVMERNPASFAAADEETIRTHFLVPLNANYEGAATGETFNGNGKTDILIRVEGKNVFIAECKFWKGPESLSKAIDQLMGYLSWRDTKCAIVVLVRDTGMSTVLSKVPGVLQGHPLFKRPKPAPEHTWFRGVLRHPSDENREAVVTVMVFHVPNT